MSLERFVGFAKVSMSTLLTSLCVAACETLPTAVGAAQTHPIETLREAPEYTLGAGDQLRVIVFGEDDLSGEFWVDGNGSISMPLIGEILASGQTLREFQRRTEQALRGGYLKAPRVSAEVLNYRPYYILGEVENSGEYPFANGLTVVNAVATAGGFTYRAKTKIVFIKRSGDMQEIRYPLTAITPVHPGDTIRVAERLF